MVAERTRVPTLIGGGVVNRRRMLLRKQHVGPTAEHFYQLACRLRLGPRCVLCWHASARQACHGALGEDELGCFGRF